MSGRRTRGSSGSARAQPAARGRYGIIGPAGLSLDRDGTMAWINAPVSEMAIAAHAARRSGRSVDRRAVATAIAIPIMADSPGGWCSVDSGRRSYHARPTPPRRGGAERVRSRTPREARHELQAIEALMTLTARKRRRAPGSSAARRPVRRVRAVEADLPAGAPLARPAAGRFAAHALDPHRPHRRAGRRRHHEPAPAAACSRRPASTPRPCMASSRRSSAARSRARTTTRASGRPACR